LSIAIRDAWDGVPLGSLSKHDPISACDYHIGIIGHSTRDDVIRLLDAVMCANGFGNRFLWICVHRRQRLPFGGSVNVDLGPIVTQVRAAAHFAANAGEIPMDTNAAAIWETVYFKLTEPGVGLLGAILGRAEAQVVRLALIYALLDCSRTIQPVHLNAALSAWEYCDSSATKIFGDLLGDPTADEILKALRASPDGLTRTQISSLFAGHAKETEIARALRVLGEQGLAKKDSIAGAGRPAEAWKAVMK
jgi:hypothetical protein